MKAFGWGAVKLDVFDAALLAELALIVATTFFVDYKDIWLVLVERREEVDDTTTLVDAGFLDVFDALYHEEALLLREHRLAMLVLLISGVGTNADIKISEL